MAKVILIVMFAAAEGFLVYVLVQFMRELRQDRKARASNGAIPIVPVGECCKPLNVIEITSARRKLSENHSRQRAS